MKLLSENLSSHGHQETMCPAPKPCSALPPSSESYTTLTGSAGGAAAVDSYDKQVINNIFDSLLQKWPGETAYSDTTAQVRAEALG